MHAQPSPGQSENYGCDKASKNLLPSDSNFVFQIRRIWMQICHAITACYVKLSYKKNNMAKKSQTTPVLC